MAVDLSDPAVITAIGSIVDPVSPISWLSLSYHPSKEKTFVLVSTGFDPWVPAWQEAISARLTEPLFGYGVIAKGRAARDGGEKGVILVYLPDQVTGIRRARAVVHSRALINTFPDYSAIITISHPSQISEEFVREQVNYYNQPVPTPTSSPIRPHHLAQSTLGSGQPSQLADGATEQGSNGTAGRARNQQNRSVQPSSSSIRSVDRPLPPPPAEPLDLPDNPALQGTPTATPPRSASPPPAPAASPTPNTATTPPHTPAHGRKDSLTSRFAKVLPIFSKSGHSNSPPRSPVRSTFESLTTGFGTGRRNSAGHGSGRDVSEMGQQGGVGEQDGRFRADGGKARADTHRDQHRDDHGVALDAHHTRALEDSVGAGRRPGNARPDRMSTESSGPRRTHDESQALADGPSATEPLLASPPPPPLPPKDLPAVSDAASPLGVLPTTNEASPTPPTLNRLHTLGAVVPTPPSDSEPSSASHTPRSPFPLSPTASAVLATARERQVSVESQMHDDFRRTEEERNRIRTHSGHREARIIGTPTPEPTPNAAASSGYANTAYDDDEEEGLPYDRPDTSELESSGRGSGKVEVSSPPEDPRMAIHDGSNGLPPGAVLYEDGTMLTPAEALYTIPEASRSALSPASNRSTTPADSATAHIPGAFPRSANTTDQSNVIVMRGDPPIYSELDRHPQQPVPIARTAAQTALADGEAPYTSRDDRSVQTEQVPSGAAESTNQPSTSRQPAGVLTGTSEAVPISGRDLHSPGGPDAQISAPNHVNSISERDEAAEAERARMEELRRLEAEEEERRREFQAQAEAYAEEQEQKRLRAIADAEAAEAAEREREKEAKRKEEALQAMRAAKMSGGEMLRGHVTVQTTTSVIWRRRYFQLYADEIRLFKTDTDTAPIQVIPLPPTLKVLQQYEESQVQGSFKLAASDGSGEDIFMFSDTPEEREMLLNGLSIALAA